jgi:3-hydroxybutyryl-CoA dehydrogenase/5-formyl-3-hydroxy-2-methylpyridine 4-carboxylate dehydrogenase
LVETIRGFNLIPLVVKRDVAGFVENRILYAIMREALDLVESGVIDPEDLDRCVSWGIGYKLAVVGPMALLDMAGLDIYQSVGGYLNGELSTRTDVSAYVTDRTRTGDLGLKTGKGIFSYSGQEAANLRAERAKRFVAVRRALEQDA